MGVVQFQHIYNKSSNDTSISNINKVVYVNSEIGTWFPNIDLSNYYIKTEIDDLDNGLPTLVLHTYSNSELDTLFTYYYNIEHLNTQFG